MTTVSLGGWKGSITHPRTPCSTRNTVRRRGGDRPRRDVIAPSAACGSKEKPLAGIQERTEVERYMIHDATVYDYKRIAEVHCKSFYGDLGPFWDTLLQTDRVLALHQGDTASPPSFSCMAAVDTLNSPTDLSRRGSSGVVEQVLSLVTGEPELESGEGSAGGDKNIVGAVVVDTHMAFIPPRFTWPAFFNSQLFNISPRPKTAYISNLAVCSSLRRSGIGTKLIRAAEARALEWGCSWIALHVDPANTAAYSLYKGLGYRPVSRQSPWQAFLEGRRQPLELMVNSLSAS